MREEEGLVSVFSRTTRQITANRWIREVSPMLTEESMHEEITGFSGRNVTVTVLEFRTEASGQERLYQIELVFDGSPQCEPVTVRLSPSDLRELSEIAEKASDLVENYLMRGGTDDDWARDMGY